MEVDPFTKFTKLYLLLFIYITWIGYRYKEIFTLSKRKILNILIRTTFELNLMIESYD